MQASNGSMPAFIDSMRAVVMPHLAGHVANVAPFAYCSDAPRVAACHVTAV